MNNPWWRSAFIVASLTLGPAGAATADQRDGRLPGLFSELLVAGNAERAKATEGRIWSIWLEIGRAGEPADAFRRGLAMMARNQPYDALRAFDAVVEMAPEFAEGWNKRATLRYGLGDLDGSAADIARTLSLEPRHFGALSGLGLVRLAQGRPADALAAFEKAVAIHPYVIDRDQLTALRDKVRGKPL